MSLYHGISWHFGQPLTGFIAGHLFVLARYVTHISSKKLSTVLRFFCFIYCTMRVHVYFLYFLYELSIRYQSYLMSRMPNHRFVVVWCYLRGLPVLECIGRFRACAYRHGVGKPRVKCWFHCWNLEFSNLRIVKCLVA